MTGLRVENIPKRTDILHNGRLGVFSDSAAEYTSSIEIDGRLLEAVVKINSAHTLMLARQRILDQLVARQLIRALDRVPKNLKLSPTLEDVHMNVEQAVISQVGKDVGGMLNLGKSRNDQVATALRIALRNELLEIGRSLVGFQETLLRLALKYSSSIMPGYTHLQRAQPVTLGHHLLAYSGSVERNIERILDCYARVNKSPMGAGALASTGFNIDRSLVASLLGFDGLVENSLDAVSSRDFAIEAVYVCAETMADLSRLAEELVIWTTKEFSFAEIADTYASTSSMMPQKKNPVVAEIARARASQVFGDLVSSLSIVKSLPLSYNLDLQELTRNLWSATDKTKDSVRLLSMVLGTTTFNEEALRKAVSKDESLFATELADYLVSKYHLSFRDAHGRVASLVRHSAQSLTPDNALTGIPESDLSAILGVPISQAEVKQLADAFALLKKRNAAGSPNPSLVKEACRKLSKAIVDVRKNLDRLVSNLYRADRNLKLAKMRLVASHGLSEANRTKKEGVRR